MAKPDEKKSLDLFEDNGGAIDAAPTDAETFDVAETPDEPKFVVKTDLNQISTAAGTFKDGDEVNAFAAGLLEDAPDVEVEAV